MRLLLDTHVLLWWLADDRKLAKPAREIIANPNNDVHVSSASIWETAIKAALGRLDIELDDLEDAIVRNAFRPLPIGFRHAVTAGRLPSVIQHVRIDVCAIRPDDRPQLGIDRHGGEQHRVMPQRLEDRSAQVRLQVNLTLRAVRTILARLEQPHGR